MNMLTKYPPEYGQPTPLLVTHDHKGRKLSPALAQLLSSTVIPKQKPSRSSYKRPHGHKLARKSPFQADLDFDLPQFSLPESPDSLPLNISTPSSTSGLSYWSSASATPLSPPDEPTSADLDTWRGAFRDSVVAIHPVPDSKSLDSLDPESLDADDTIEVDAFSFDDEDEVDLTNCLSDPTPLVLESWAPSPRSDSSSDDTDYHSVVSGSPSSITGNRTRRKMEFPPLESADHHPLVDSPEQAPELVEPPKLVERSSSVISKTKKLLGKQFLVSNLTASLKVISSVASSLSNSQQRIDSFQSANMLALSPRIMDEARPTRLTPSPLTRTAQAPAAAPSAVVRPKAISLTTYNIQATIIPHLRPRELRMNTDFYRIYALELLMRQHGKVDPEFPGRAQMVLEPRKDSNLSYYDEMGGEEVFGIRKRFVSRFDVHDKSKTPTKPVTSSALASCVCVNDF